MIHFLKYRLPLYAAIALAAFLGVQLIYLHIKGIESSPVQSIYRKAAIKRDLRPDPPPKGSEPREKGVKGFIRHPDKSEGPSNPFTLGSWKIEESLCAGLKVEVTADKEGNPILSYTPMSFGFLEIGRTREIYIYGNKWWEWKEEARQGWQVGVGYHHDLGRIGPFWSSLYGQAGWEHEEVRGIELEGFRVEGGVRIGVRL